MISEYINDGFWKVEGFCALQTFYVLSHMNDLISISNKEKRVMEIGIHHGQLFIGMNQFADDVSYAIDVFTLQEFNIDNSGKANLFKFKDNLRLYDHKHHGSNVQIIEGDSLNHKIFSNIKDCHYISIDGGHTPIHVVNDIRIAEDYMTHDGIVIVDDYMNHWWPSVTEGIVKYLLATPMLIPFCSSPNKLWLCRPSYHTKYLDHMKKIENFGKTDTKFFGYDLVDVWV